MKNYSILFLLSFYFSISIVFGQQKFNPINPNATSEANELLKYLYANKGGKIISGQHNFNNSLHKYHERVNQITGKYPAIWGTDFILNGREDNGSRIVQEAFKKHKEGYFITLMWHAGRPQEDPPFGWKESVQAELTETEWNELTTQGTELHSRWIKQVDQVASYLKQLENLDVPVLWRPYHEMNGVWFWWGDKKGKSGFEKLWKMMYERYTNYHKLNNLIWVWNANSPRDLENDEAYGYKDYFPGTEYVDVLAADVYHNDYRQSHHDQLLELGKGKIIALGEVGEVPSNEILRAQPSWSWFMVWSNFIHSPNEPGEIQALYGNPSVLTLDEIKPEIRLGINCSGVSQDLESKISGSNLEKKFIDAINNFKNDGFSGVLISSEEINSIDESGLKNISNYLKDNNIFIEYSIEFLDINEVDNEMKIAQTLNAQLIHLNNDIIDPKDTASTNAVLRQLDFKSEEMGIKIALKYQPLISSDDILLPILQLNSPNIGLVLDLMDFSVSKEETIKVIDKTAPYLFSINISDYLISYENNGFKSYSVPLGEGLLDLAAIIKRITEKTSLDRMIINNAYDRVLGEKKIFESSDSLNINNEKYIRQLLVMQNINYLDGLKDYSIPDTIASLKDKIEGMLIGSAIGDAAGGPLEFVEPAEKSFWSLTNQKLTNEGIEELGSLFKLRQYRKKVEPFAQFEDFAPEGTITDDTRFKIILFNTLRDNNGKLNRKNFAASILNFKNELPEKYYNYYDEWMREINYAANFELDNTERSYPSSRIWGSIPTMMGQMPFLPIAALNPSDPEWTYLKTYELGFFDNGIGKDINSSIVAGLTRALQSNGSWFTVKQTMFTVDPYGYNRVLYVNRQMEQWLDLAHNMVNEADGNIAKLFHLLENKLNTQFWWEAWVPLVVVFSCAEIVNYHPLASMQLMLEFGHDTDSYAQIMGAFMGAIHGKEIFPKEMRDKVNREMNEQYGQNITDWMKLIEKYGEVQ